MLKLIKVALNLKLPLCYDLKKSGNFKFRATFMSLSFILRPELRFSGLYLPLHKIVYISAQNLSFYLEPQSQINFVLSRQFSWGS